MKLKARATNPNHTNNYSSSQVNYLHPVIWLLLCSFLLSVEAEAQIKKPGQYSATVYSSVAKQDYQPLWLAANRQGFFEEFSQANALLRLQGYTALQSGKTFDYAYGLDVAARAAEINSQIYFQQLYVSAKASIFQLDAGWKYHTVGENPKGLSSGSMSISGNSRSIPRINISVPEFTPVPFTYNFIQFMGNVAHGWLGNDRHTAGAYIHEKTFYLQGGFDHWPVQGYAGMVHFVQWGGNSPDRGKLPSGLDDFISVVLGKEGGSDAPGPEQLNALGNHLGIWDFGLKAQSKSFRYQLYWQHPYEDFTGLMFRNIGDGLWGASIQRKRESWLSGILYEVLYTKNQSGPGLSDRPGDFPFCEKENCGYKYGGRDNYYNNGVYPDGWTHKGRTLGTPLFLTTAKTQAYLPGAKLWNSAIESNRVLAHHAGFEGLISPQLSYKALVTYARHYGNYKGLNRGQPFGSKDPANDLTEYEFYPALEQWSFLLETNYTFRQLPQMEFNTAFALDTGELTNNAGLLVGATWNFK